MYINLLTQITTGTYIAVITILFIISYLIHFHEHMNTYTSLFIIRYCKRSRKIELVFSLFIFHTYLDFHLELHQMFFIRYTYI